MTAAPIVESVLELRDLSKRFGDVQALDGASFEVPPGRMVGFLGPNGAGKTTAMRSIFGLVRLDRGEVLWDGKPLDEDEARRFGYMPEARGLYPKMTVGDQVEYFARLHGSDRSGAKAHADRWLERLDLVERRDSRVETLSHGNQQRVQLAVSLAFESDLLILDEPFSGLDPIAVTTMGDVIREEAHRGAGVLFSSHQLDLVEVQVVDLGIPVHQRLGMLRADVLVQAAAERDIDQLQAAADAEHRLARVHECLDQRDLVAVAMGVALPGLPQRRLAVAAGPEIGAAVQHQAIEPGRIVGKTDVAARGIAGR